MRTLKQFKQLIAKGVSLHFGGYKLQLKVGRVGSVLPNDTGLLGDLDFRQATYLRNKYPFLATMGMVINRGNASDVLRCYLEILPAIDKSSREVCVRNALHRLESQTPDQELKMSAVKEIARSDLRSGIPDRAKVLLGEKDLEKQVSEQLALSDQAYGADLLTQPWPNVSRGQTLCHYFNAHVELVRGRRILHFSPEPELRDWICGRAKTLGLIYETSNIVGQDVDLNQDLTAMTVTHKYDLIICHRVFEHVMDDGAAFRELYRILAPGGLLQISVPQSMQEAATKDWVIPDQTHHEHVRHYGRDFSARLESAGFSVAEELWLLRMPRQELLANGAYPLRMYHACKPL